MYQAETDHEASDTDEDESSSPRADSSSADDDDEEVFYDASDLSRSNSLQASRSLSLPAFEGDSALDSARCLLSLILGMQIVHKAEAAKHRQFLQSGLSEYRELCSTQPLQGSLQRCPAASAPCWGLQQGRQNF